MKYTYTLEITPEEVGTLMREVSSNLPAFVDGVARMVPDLLARLQAQHPDEDEPHPIEKYMQPAKDGQRPPAGANREAGGATVLKVLFGAGDPDSAAPRDNDEGPPRDILERLEWYDLVHARGLMRTLEVVFADDTTLSIGERGLADRPASYEGEGVIITVNWPTVAECGVVDDAWYEFLTAWCHNYEFASDDPEEAERRPKMLQALIGTPGEVSLKKHIIFNAQACMNRAVYTSLTSGLAFDGQQNTRFREESLLDVQKLADHISANIMLVAHGIMPELRVFHDITGKWFSFIPRAE